MGLLDSVTSCVTGGFKAIEHMAGEAVGSAVATVAGKEVGRIAGDLVEGAASKVVDSVTGHFGDIFNTIRTALSALNGGVGKVAEEVVGALLPEQLKPLKDLVGAAVNLSTGNYPAVINEGLDFLQHLPELSKELSKLSANLSPSAPPANQGSSPTAPEHGRASDPSPAARHRSHDASAVHHRPHSTGPDRSGWHSSTTPASSPGSTSSTSSTSQASTASGASQTSQAGTTSSAPSSTSGASSTASAGSTDKTQQSAGKTAAQKFLSEHSDPEDFMKQIRSGNIPDEVLNSQAGMMMVQERLQSIQQMNQLMTQMLKSMHDMSMAVVQNVRV